MSRKSPQRSILAAAVFAALTATAAVALAEPEAPPATETQAPSAVSPGAATAEQVPPQPRFDIREFRVDGNSVLPKEAIERAVYPYLGPAKTLTDIQDARKVLEEAYHKAGFKTVVVTIPEQQVVGGLVNLQVTEGRVGKVRVLGSRYYLPSRIRGELQALAPGAVLHLPTFQEELTALNRTSSDRQVTPVLRAGTVPGTVEVDLQVRDNAPLHASLEINNRASANTEPLRAIASLRYDNLWQREHSFTLLYQTAPQATDQVQVYSGTYLFRSDDALDMTVIYGLHSSSNLSVVGGTTVIGSGNIFGLRKIFALPRSPGFQQSLSLGADYKSFGEDVVLGSDSLSTPIQYLPFAVLYNASRFSPASTTQYSAALNFSVRGLNDETVDCFGQELDQFQCKRVGASSNYAYLRFDLQHTRELVAGWMLAANGDAQLAGQPLISNEQYSAGGLSSVRGYYEAARLGDDGWRASLELRTPTWNPGERKGHELYAMLFYDYARLRVQEPLPGQESRFRLRGTGVGLRSTFWGKLKGEVYAAYALDEAPDTREGDYRVHARLEYGF